jgi:hypothetical protein
MKMKFASLFRPLLFVALFVAVLACKKKNNDNGGDPTPTPANVITAGTTSHKITHAYHQNDESGRYHVLAFTSESLELKEDNYLGSGKLVIIGFDTEKETARIADAVLLLEGTYTSEKIEFAFLGDFVEGNVVSDNSVELNDSEIKITKSGDIYTILIKSRDRKKNEDYKIYYQGKLEEARIAM